MIICRLLIFFEVNVFANFFQEYHKSVIQFGASSGPTFDRPDRAPNCLQKSAADDTSRQRVYKRSHEYLWCRSIAHNRLLDLFVLFTSCKIYN